MKMLLSLICFLVTLQSFAASPVIWGPNDSATNLEHGLQFGVGGPGTYTGATNPTIIPFSAPAGSMYYSSSTFKAYIKQDAGLSVNWLEVTTGGTGWLLAGNLGTGGTGVLGTTDAQPFSLITNGVTQVTYNVIGGWSSIQNITPVDATNHFQALNQVNYIPAGNTATANFIGENVAIGYDGGNTGFNYGGNLSGVNSDVSHTGSGTVGFINPVTGNSSFGPNAGTTTLVKGVQMKADVASGYTINSYEGVDSYMNSTGGIFGNADMFQYVANYAGGSSNSLTGINGNLDVNGAHVGANGISGLNLNTTQRDTASSNQLIGELSNTNLLDTATANDVMGTQIGATVSNGAVVSGQLTGSSVGATLQNTATANGVTGQAISVQLQNTADGGNVVSSGPGVFLTGAATALSVTGVNPQVQVSGTSAVTNTVTGVTPNVGLFDTASTASLNGENIDVSLHNSSVATSVRPFSVNLQLLDTAAITNAFTVADINASTAVAVADGITGLNVSIDNVIVPDALSKNVLTLFGGKIQSDSTFTIPPADTFFQQLYSGSHATVAAAAPISTLMLGANINPNTIFNDDWTADFTGLRIGLAAVSVIPTIVGAAGKTMDSYEAFIGAFNNTSGSGTLDQAFMFRAMGGLPAGGTLLVNNMTAFGAASPLCALAGNCWGVKIEDTAANNAFAKNVLVGATTPANASVGIELTDTTKSLLVSRLTTAQRNALTPLEGMVIENTTTNKLQFYDGTAWVDTSSGASPSGGVVVFQQSGGTSVLTDMGNPYVFNNAATITTVQAAMLNGGTSGNTTFTMNQYRAGALINSGQGIIANNAGLVLASTITLAPVPLNILADDVVTVDITGVAGGAPEDLSIVINSGALAGGIGPTGPAGDSSIFVAAKSANYSMVITDNAILSDATGGAFNVTLPTAAASFVGGKSFVYTIKKVDVSANVVTILPPGAETIDGAASLALSAQGDSVDIYTDGTNFYVK